jgi:hypothetical protein
MTTFPINRLVFHPSKNACESTHLTAGMHLHATTTSWTQPNLWNWPAYYDLSSQLLCLPPSATAAPGTTASRRYHPAQITHTRRFLALSKSNTFAHARPEIDAVPATVLLETPTLLRCSLPPISNTPVLDTIHTPVLETIHTTTSTTIKDYVTNLPTWEQDLLLHATEKPSTLSLYELLTQKHTTLLAVSGGDTDEPKSYGSFTWH